MDTKEGGIILERHHLAAAAFCGVEGRYNIAGVNVCPDGSVQATNGHYLITVPPSQYPAADFPEVDGKGAGLTHEAIVPADAFKAAEKALPKKSHLPILACAHLGNTGPSVKITTTDLETHTVRAVTPIQAKFPDISQVIPQVTDASLHIVLNVAYLKEIIAYAAKVGSDKAIELVIPDPSQAAEKPVMFSVGLREFQKATIVLMPMRIK